MAQIAQQMTTDEVKLEIRTFLARPEALSKVQKKRIQQGFAAQDHEVTVQGAQEVLSVIQALDSELTSALAAFTPHDSCQISLIREALLDEWATGRLATQPIRLAASR